MARPKNVALQEMALAEAQKKLDRIEKMRVEMAKQVELEIKRLEEMREKQEDFTMSAAKTPSLGKAAPETFESQFDKFKSTQSNERLTTIGNEGAIDFTGKLTAPKDDTPFYRTNDRAEHWDKLDHAPGDPVYVSGYYYSNGSDTKQYEYMLWPGAFPVKVGDMVSAPVHPIGYHQGKHSKKGHDRRFIITDIYSKEKFLPYHDLIR